MFLYHGTPEYFEYPSLSKCKPHRDFGCGFYTTPNYIDALPMAVKNTGEGYIQTYLLEDTDGLSVLEFAARSEKWLRFVVASRLGAASDYDLVIGYMAGGGRNLKSKFSKFRRNGAEVQVVMDVMRDELIHTDLGTQFAFLTDDALRRMRLIDVERVERECEIC